MMKSTGLNVYPSTQKPTDDDCSPDGFINILYSFNGMLKLQALSRFSSYFTNTKHFYTHHVGSIVLGWIPASNTIGYEVWLNRQIDSVDTGSTVEAPSTQKTEKRKIRVDEI